MQVANTPRRNSTEIPAEYQFIPSKSRVKQIQRFTWRYNFVDEGHNSSRPWLHFHQLASVWPLTMGLDGSDEFDDLPFKLELIQRDTQSISNPSPSFHPRIGSLSSVGRLKLFRRSSNQNRPLQKMKDASKVSKVSQSLQASSSSASLKVESPGFVHQ